MTVQRHKNVAPPMCPGLAAFALVVTIAAVPAVPSAMVAPSAHRPAQAARHTAASFHTLAPSPPAPPPAVRLFAAAIAAPVAPLHHAAIIVALTAARWQ